MPDLVNGLGGPDGFGTDSLGANDDGSTSAIDITAAFPNGFQLFGSTYETIYINNNGNITFGSPLSNYTPESIGTGFTDPIIAPFWADVDTRGGPTTATGGNTTGSNLVWYDVNPATQTVTVTWDDVGYYSEHTDKTDAFQLQLIGGPNGAEHIKFIYQSIEWTAGDASGGFGGLGGTPARAGYSAGDGVHYFELPGSGDETAMLSLPTTTGDTGAAGVSEFAAGLSGVYSLAHPVLSTGGGIPVSAVDFGAVRAGSSPSRQITVTNDALAPAEDLDASVAATGGATATGSITQLEPGQSDSNDLVIGLSTTSAGPVTGSVVVAFTSNGMAVDGLPSTVLPGQKVEVTGTVYEEAQPSLSTPSPFIVHVGDSGVASLIVSNASGDVENLAADVTSVTGAVSAPLEALPEIAAGGTAEVPLTFSTAAAGTVTGAVTLSYKSDGASTDNAPITVIGSGSADVSVTVDNYAKLGLSASAGQLTFDGTEYVLNLGSIAQGGAPLSATLSVSNTASGPADLLSGDIHIANSTGFSNTGAGSYANLASGVSADAETISLGTASAGTFSETLTLDSIGSNASGYSNTLPEQKVLVTGTVTPSQSSGQLSIDLELPQTTTLGQSGAGVVHYSNTGNSDLPAQILEITSPDALLSGTGETAASHTVLMLSTSGNGAAGTLAPGAAGTLSFTYTPVNPTDGENVAVSVGTPAAGSAIDWSSLEESLRPPTVDAADWNNVWKAFTDRVGATTDSLTAALSQDATELAQVGQPTNDVGALLQFELFQASGALAGTYLSAATDIDATSSSLSLSLDRYYDGTLLNRDHAGAFGDGWTFAYDINATTDADGNVYIQSPGALHVFTLQADGSYAASSGDGATLTLSGGAYRMKDASGDTEQFGTDGKLARVTDSNGNTIALTYGGDGVLQTVKSLTTGETIAFTSNASGRITKAADSDGRTVTYSYDSTGTHLLSASGASSVTTYAYATPTGTLQDNALTSVTTPNGAVTSFAYDLEGRLATQSDSGGTAVQTYSYTNPGEVAVTDALGKTTTLLYGASGDVAEVKDALGNVTQLTSDASGNLTGIQTAQGELYRYAYDAAGNLTSSTSPTGATVSASYDPTTQNLTTFTDQLGSQIHYTYDGAGNVTDVTYQDGSGNTYQYDTKGLLTSSTDADGNIIAYSYDSAGDLTRKAFADGTADTYAYDSHGNLTAATAQDGGTTHYAYDSADRLISVTDANGRVESYTYNSAGQEATRTEPDGSVTQYSYDSDGRLTELRDGAGNLLDKYTYNGAGQLVRTDTGNGASTTYTYDAAGNVTEILNKNADGSVGSRFDYTYDEDGLVTAEATPDGDWSYSYDATGQLTHAVFASTNSAIQSQDIRYTYDAAGNRISESINGVTTDYTSNSLNQYISAGATTYAYDSDGGVVSATTTSGTIHYSYDQNGQLISEAGPHGNYHYSYDALGNLTSVTQNGDTTEYVNDPLALNSSGGALSSIGQAYDSNGGLESTYEYGLGLAAAVGQNNQLSYYQSDASGNITGLTGASGDLVTSYTYDPFGQILASTGTTENPFKFSGSYGVISNADGLVQTKARVYNPATGSFTSMDPLGALAGPNAYTYSANNPISFGDPSGLLKVFQGFSGTLGLFGGAATIGTGAEIVEGALAVGTAFGTAPVLLTLAVGGLLVAGGIYALKEADEDIAESLHDGPQPQWDWANAPGAIFSAATAIVPISKLLGKIKLPDKYSAWFGPNERELAGTAIEEGTDSIFNLIARKIEDTKTTRIIPASQSGSQNSKTASADGCPHFTTYDGLHFDFQGAGEFIAAKSTVAGDNFQVQMRIEPEGSADSSVSIITQIAVQVGSHRVTFGVPQSLDAARSQVVWLDGAPAAIDQSHPVLTLDGGTVTEISSNEYRVALSTGEVVAVNPFGDGMGYSISLPEDAVPGSVEGFLGPDKGKADDFQLPDGTVLQQPLTQDQLYHQFADAWRVTDSNSLLDYAPGQTTATFTNTQYPREILTLADFPPDLVARAAALAAAAGITDPTLAADAEFDYITMGNPNFFSEDAKVASENPATPVAASITDHTAPPPSLGALPDNPQLVENNGATTSVSFTVNLTSAATADTTVDYAVVPGGGVNSGKDYLTAADFGGTLPAGSVIIAAGQTQAEVAIDVPNSAIGSAASKWLMISVSSEDGNPVYDPAGQVEIVNNQPVAGNPAQAAIQILASATPLPTENGETLTKAGDAYTVDLGNVLSGTDLPVLQFAIANVASPPADRLMSDFSGETGSGFAISGVVPTGEIAAGSAYENLSFQPDPSTLGTHSESVTVTSTDSNDTGYSTALPDMTLTVKDNVIAPAQPSLATQTVSLPNVRVGEDDSEAIAISNAATQPAADLDVLMTAGAGGTTSGSVTGLAPGMSDSADLRVGLNTSTAGLHTSTVTLNPSSDLGNGVTAALPNLPVTLSGSVFREASGEVTVPTTIIHVGDAGVVPLDVKNRAAADGYSEALVASIGATSGDVTVSTDGPTSDIAAGSADSNLNVLVPTTEAGVQSGAASVALASDGGTGDGSIDSLGQVDLAPVTVPISVQVDNYASAQLTSSAGALAPGSQPNTYTLDLGAVVQGQAPLVASIAALNAANGPADDLNGAFTLSGDPEFSNTGFDPFSATVAGESSANDVVKLNTNATGTFSETIVLHPTDTNNTGYSAVLPDQILKITATVLPAGTASGDVHLVTFDGLHYDFQAVGDFNLVQSTAADNSFRIQIHTEAYPLRNAASVITKEAAQIGYDVVTFGDGDTGVLINGQQDTALSGSHPTQFLEGGELRLLSPNEYELSWTAGESLIVTNLGGYLNDAVALGPNDQPGSVQGLLGSDTGQANDIALPDGTVLPQPVPAVELLTTFANAWSVQQGESLLDGVKHHPSVVNNTGTRTKSGSGASAIAALNNTGTVKVQEGTLDVQGAVTGAGTDMVSATSTLEFDATVSRGQIVGFTGTGGTVDLNDPQGFFAEISNFGSNDAIDLLGSWAFSGFTEDSSRTGGALTLAGGSTNVALNFSGNYTTTDFNIHMAGGHTIIEHT
jgi:RHS repeat-associated protein